MTDDEKLASIEAKLTEAIEVLERAQVNVMPLVDKSKNLVALLDDAERNQGGLVSVDILRSANELRLELARWR